MYVVLLCKMAPVTIFDKIIYDGEEMNQMKKVFGRVRWLENCY